MKHYYQINDEKYVNAIETWARIKSLKDSGVAVDMKLVIDNDRLANYDWQSIPRNIAELEEEFANRLRQQYDYVRLVYSGGSDSHSIADAFLRSNNRIDEFIIMEYSSQIASGGDSLAQTSMKKTWLDELHTKYNMPISKITVLTIDQKIHDNWFQPNWFLNHAGYSGTEKFNANHIGDLLENCPPPVGIENYINVMGYEKPRLFADTNAIWFQMNDKHTLAGASSVQPTVWFYLSGDAMELVNAQCRGALAVARGLFPNLSLSEALHQLQTNLNFYHEWCLSLGRVTSKFQNTLSLTSKPSGHSEVVNGVDLERRYVHIEQYANDKTSIAWKSYQDFVHTAKELNNGQPLPGIQTQKFILAQNSNGLLNRSN